MTHSLRFCLTDEIFISFSLLKDDFAKCQLAFLSQYFNISLYSFLLVCFLRTVSCDSYLWSSIGRCVSPLASFMRIIF